MGTFATCDMDLMLSSVHTPMVSTAGLVVAFTLIAITSILCWTWLRPRNSDQQQIKAKLQSVPRAQLQGALVETARAIEATLTNDNHRGLSARAHAFSPTPRAASDESRSSSTSPSDLRSVSLDSTYTYGSTGTISMDLDASSAPFHMPSDHESGSSEELGSSADKSCSSDEKSDDEVVNEEASMSVAEMDNFAALLDTESSKEAPNKRNPRIRLACDWPDECLWSSRKYLKFLESSCKEWEALGPQKSRHVKSLYCFWGYRLRKNFDMATYIRFKEMALADAKAGTSQVHRYGLETLCRFYSYGLEIEFREFLFSDFQSVTCYDYEHDQLYALEKFWAFLFYNQNKHAESVSPKLDLVLQKYTCLEDFQPKHKASSSSQAEGKWQSSRTRSTTWSKKGQSSNWGTDQNSSRRPKPASQEQPWRRK